MSEHAPMDIADLYERLTMHEKRLATHEQNCSERFDRGEEQFGQILRCLTENTAAIKEVHQNTAGIVQAYQDVQASARVGNTVLHVVWTMTKTGGLIAALGYGLSALIEHFKRHPPSN